LRIARAEEEAARLKFPVKDEQLEALLAASAAALVKSKAAQKAAGVAPTASSSSSSSSSSGPQKETTEMRVAAPVKPLPAAVMSVGSILRSVPDEQASEAIEVWDFLNLFRYMKLFELVNGCLCGCYFSSSREVLSMSLTF
jgi:hypothetical protein